MKTPAKPLAEINSEAIRLLTEQLGLSDALRFVSQFSTGHGNYTAERAAMFRGLTVNDIASAIETQRPPRKSAQRPKRRARTR